MAESESLQMNEDSSPAQDNVVVGPQEALGHALGFLARNEFTYADEMLDKILAILPDDPETLHVKAVSFCEQKRLAEAEPILEKLCREHPDSSAYVNTLGRLYWLQGRSEAAYTAWNKALALAPQGAEPYLNIAEAEREAKNYDAAITAYQDALRLRPFFPKASLGMAQIYVLRDGWGAAIPYYQMAVAQDPDNPNTLFQLSQALGAAGHMRESVKILEDIVKRWDFHWAGWLNLAAYYERSGMYDKAFAAAEKSLTLAATDPGADEWATLNLLVQLQRATATWEGLQEREARLIAHAREQYEKGEPVSSVRPFLTLYTAFPPELQLAVAKAAADVLPQYGQDRWSDEVVRAPGRLRIGYLIADIRNHPNAHNTLLMYGLHDREKVEVFTYSWGDDDSGSEHRRYRRRIVESSEHFTEMKGWSDEAMVQKIVADGIQILVDLMGHTGDNRMTVLARRPAPIQVNFLGYPGTTGAEYMDYILGDQWVTPMDRAEEFAETIVQLPWTYQINSHRDVPLEGTVPRSELDLPEDAFVYCCFNSNYKITPEVFACWMRILGAVPNSVLWLLRGNAETEAHFQEVAEAQGVDPKRLVFAPFWSREMHLKRAQAADLFLDTTPYSAHTTASDALWAGVPVITVPGETFASRVAASLLRAAHLEECILPDWETYESMAIALAGEDRPVLEGWRARLRDHTADLPIFDTPGLVRDMEAAYQQMWDTFLSGRPPKPFAVSMAGDDSRQRRRSDLSSGTPKTRSKKK